MKITFTLLEFKQVDKKKCSRNGTLKADLTIDRSDTKILSYHPYILCHFAILLLPYEKNAKKKRKDMVGEDESID